MAMRKAHWDAGGNNVQKQGPTDNLMSQAKPVALTTVGAGTITVDSILAGIVDRTGPVGAFVDTFPSALALQQAIPEFSDQDSFEFLYRNGVAFAMTAALASAADVLVNSGVAASAIRRYLVTLLAGGSGGVLPATTVNGSPIVTVTDLRSLDPIVGVPSGNGSRFRVGQLVTGTGIPASTVVRAINYTTGQITLSANATADGVAVALTFAPRVEYRGLWSATA